MTKKQKHILIITSWYPYTNDKFYGFFVQQFARYISEYHKVSLININNRAKKESEGLQIVEQDKFEEFIYNLPANKNKQLNNFNYLRVLNKAYKAAKNKHGKPDIVHLQIPTKTLLYAYYLKIFRKTPFIITEHWSKYLNTNAKFSFLQKQLSKKASEFIAVSHDLAQSLEKLGFSKDIKIIANPIDEDLFSLSNNSSEIFRFVHVSCFDEKIKNIKGIIKACNILEKKDLEFEMLLVGTGVDFEKVRSFAESFNLKNIKFLGEKSNEDFAKILSQSDVLVMNSRKETFGIPVVEAWMCGIPVISTPAGIAQIEHPSNAIILTEIDNTNSLADAMMKLLKEQPKSLSEIREYAIDNFGKNSVVKQYNKIYNSVLER